MRLFSALFYLMIFLLIPSGLRAEEWATFDGQVYNGKYYPRMDIIEWGNPSHMEFHVYSKGKPINMSFQLDETKKNKVMMVRYDLTFRNESLCRRVVAPGHFFGQNFYVYKDSSDPDFDNILVSMEKLPDKPGQVLVQSPSKYASCDMPDPLRLPAGDTKSEDAKSAGQDHIMAPPAVDGKKYKTSDGAIKSKNSDVPFGDL